MTRKKENEAGGSLHVGPGGIQPFPSRPETDARPPQTAAVDASLAKPAVSFLGPIASYSHQAALQTFAEEKWDLHPATTITDVFDNVQLRQAPLGVVPFENSSNGCVVETFDNFADRDGQYRDIVVQGEIYIDINHCLLGKKTPVDADAVGNTDQSPTEAAPESQNADFRHIQQLYSHPQALGQCRRFISANLSGAELHPVSSTSRAAEMVAQSGDNTSAAISSKLAASVYDLDALAETIQDRKDNTTRFLVIGNLQNPVQDASAAIQSLFAGANAPSGSKSLVSFTVPHGSPGALADVLCCFNEHSLNLTSINSRPSLLAPFQYVFFVELEGHRYDDDGRVERALDKISRVAQGSRWLGSWERYR
ncbi:hypothetical protein XA68_11762 [Ophiocordyceps unilateralis]|uniref:prephenate dehydratase n=1 Tax=Ophiocordyceps unilateralis TaxID=268505 RepID=A0A2A9PG67_OPHUN|nr:hypothetical protein XA68_11762 [Ophiocordyceps unilateralis]